MLWHHHVAIDQNIFKLQTLFYENLKFNVIKWLYKIKAEMSQMGKVTLRILISSIGRSWLLVSTMPMRFRTPMPWQTRPNILCLPSSHCVGASVRKNWLPFVSGPALAIARIPAPTIQANFNFCHITSSKMLFTVIFKMIKLMLSL